jgi:1-acyl-sn-glycerol-3-phosphate acyltransferase
MELLKSLLRLLYAGVASLLIFPLYTLLLSTNLILTATLFPQKDRALNTIVRWWGRGVCRLFSVKLFIRYWRWKEDGLALLETPLASSRNPLPAGYFGGSEENFHTLLEGCETPYQPVFSRDGFFPPAQAELVLFNHSSFFDIFALIAWDERIRFGAKQELFRIPIFAWAMRKAGIVPIPRQDRRTAIENLSKAVTSDRTLHPLALAPEGGRLGGDDFLAPFKSGPFYLAKQGPLSIQMVLIRGASRVWPKGALVAGARSWQYEITLDVLPPLPREFVARWDKEQIKEFMRSLSAYVLKQIQVGN